MNTPIRSNPRVRPPAGLWLALVCALGACAGAQTTAQAPTAAACPAPDAPWRATGLSDGAQGRPGGSGAARLAACGRATTGPAAQQTLDSYLSGHAEGLAIYCTPASATALGRSRATPTLTCPAHMQDAFAAAYAAAGAGAADASAPQAAGRPWPWWRIRPSVSVGIGGGGRVRTGLGIGIVF
jgi:hypothetical protein